MSQESEIRGKEATSASEGKRSMEVERKVTWRTIWEIERRVIGKERGSRHGLVVNTVEMWRRGEKL